MQGLCANIFHVSVNSLTLGMDKKSEVGESIAAIRGAGADLRIRAERVEIP